MEKTVKILVIVFAVAGLALLGYYLVNQWHTRTVAQTLEQERQGWQERVARLETEVQRLKEEVGPRTAQTDLADVFGSDKPLAQEETVDCQRITTQAVAFFRYLDGQAYLQDYNDSMRAETFFEDVFQRLAANPPTNVGEMDNLYTVIRNVTHLYRVLGKERILLINEIAKNEAPVVEPAMGVIFNWMAVCGTGKGKTPDSARLESLYQYACFFLNTMGGRGYLLRRDSKVRMLTNYYALRVVDMANDANLNSLGIDIRPHLDYLFYDINNQKGLLYRQRYLTQLAALKNKYH
ncbi:MAG: hypothetical protein VR64_10940 [Desulfatitalea sp. BRH_c12]|nr:MAG: hypothetical protein VR64_10940 [Desulfatitalea sp. BRH_c12]